MEEEEGAVGVVALEGAVGALKEGAVGVAAGADTTVGAFEEETLGDVTPPYVTFLTTPARESQK